MNHPVANQVQSPARPWGTTAAWAVGPVFVALAAWFVLASPPAGIPFATQPLVDRSLFAPGARRQPMSEPPEVVNGGYAHPCNECHRTFDSPPVEERTLTQHTDIRFDHGMNNRCFNCHDRKNREQLALHDGTPLSFEQVPQLCSQCHGTVFRDWQMGTHGKTMGSWDSKSGKQHRLNCNDCHDPHAPAYPRLVPLPSPNTLRMGDQSHTPGHLERHVPLRRWSQPGEEPHPAKPGPEPAEHQEPRP